MSNPLDFCISQATIAQLASHLRACDVTFVPHLSDRVKIEDYTHKIANCAVRFEAWSKSDLVGLLAAYCNDDEKRLAYITNLSVSLEWQNCGVGSQLIKNCITYAIKQGFVSIELHVDLQNLPAINLYKKHGFLYQEDELSVSSCANYSPVNLVRKLR